MDYVEFADRICKIFGSDNFELEDICKLVEEKFKSINSAGDYMSITEKLKLRLCEEVNFDSDGYSAMCKVIDEFAEALKPSHNSAMDAISAIECAIQIKDIWLPPADIVDEEHEAEIKALWDMYRTFLNITQEKEKHDTIQCQQ